MKFNLIFRSSVSACFEFDNNTAFYNDTPYRICVNGLWSDVEKRENVFSLFSLAPDTEYTVSTSLSNHTVTFKTLTETCAYTVKSFGATGDGVTNDTVNVQNAIDMCPDGGRVVFEKGDLTETVTGKYNVICANIVADAIMMLSGSIKSFLEKDAIYIVSGIIDIRAQEVKECLLGLGFKIIEEHIKDNWYAFVLKEN